MRIKNVEMRMLGHTQAKTTKRYAHLFDDPVRLGSPARNRAYPVGRIKQGDHAVKLALWRLRHNTA
jgi:hypothetical protein